MTKADGRRLGKIQGDLDQTLTLLKSYRQTAQANDDQRIAAFLDHAIDGALDTMAAVSCALDEINARTPRTATT